MRRFTGRDRRIVRDDSDSRSPDPVVRQLTPDDVHAAWEIFQSSPEAADWSEGSIRNSLLDKQTTALVSALGEEICGSIFGVNVAGEAEILNLAVKSNHRRMGLAKELVSRLLNEWEKQGTRRVFLEVRESNAAAIKLYEGLGFRQIGRRKGYYANPEEDALVLERPGR